MLALDMCTVNSKMTNAIIERAHEFTGIKKENILICATHLHTGAPTDKDTFIEPDMPYVDYMIRLAADAITLADIRLKPVTAKYAQGHVDSIAFVRNYKMKGGFVMTNPGRKNPDIIEPCADIDPEVPVLVFCDKAGKPVGAVISYACHQDCLAGEKTAYSTDFAGIMDKELKKEYGNDFISVFFEGACGNINHYDVNAEKDVTLEHHRMMGRVLAAEIKSVIPKAEDIEDDTIKVKKERIALARRHFSDEELKEAEEFLKSCEGKKIEYTEFNPQSDFMRFHYAHRALNYMKNTSETYEVDLQVIRIGDFLLYATPGEMFVQFGLEIKNNEPTKNRMVAEIAFDYVGYIPTKDLFQPTVYESTLPTCIFEPEGGHQIAAKLTEMGKEIIK
ncbi:MAG: hypothetical protein IKV88_01925, partial [Clostridia bacterium]|nr:hypothetical protein [Clostridia bacterium]